MNAWANIIDVDWVGDLCSCSTINDVPAVADACSATLSFCCTAPDNSGVVSEGQVRAGYIALCHGEAIEVRGDEFMSIEQPEIVNDGLRVMTEQLNN
jgi:hypothetical protein